MKLMELRKTIVSKSKPLSGLGGEHSQEEREAGWIPYNKG